MQSRRDLTITETAKEIGVSHWAARRLVDKLAPDVQRFGRFRLVPRSMLRKLRRALAKRKARKTVA
ncbi:MAG TPA: hypothetical protein VFA18_17525 [Gemmataceae bacterium]|nr:hypothetical protein [Gemmataceae bacterium]